MKTFDEAAFDSFFSSATRCRSLALLPEIQLNVAADLASLWNAQERWFDSTGTPPPYWGVPWPGGQALARFLMDNPTLVKGCSVLDLGSGCGVCAIAAARAGGYVHAADIDPAARRAIARNAQLNAAAVTVTTEDPMNSTRKWDVVLAADLWYERFMAGKVTSWLRQAADDGARVLLGDLGRAFFPRLGLSELVRFPVEATAGTEQAPLIEAGVWQLRSVSLPRA